ncbi:MAG TPA: M23 family metallopeptidase, partial [Spirochaetia bacterium]|nr:M23 family metallopeptidase [Spirochaetia bacterium]
HIELFRGSRDMTIEFPQAVGLENMLAEYLISEPIDENSNIELHPEVIKNLKVSSYTVRSGDTLSTIAQKFGLDLDTLISINGIKDARNLIVGTTLEVPNKNGLKYRVKRGDSLDRIAKKYGVGLEALVDWNNLTSSVIKTSQELFIPGAKMSANELNLVLGKLFIYPAKGKLTSRFGYRANPFTGMREFHNGIDIGNYTGTRITAAMTGKVARLGFFPGLGKYIIMIHPDAFQTLYGHLSKITVSEGTRIAQGEKIGEMGNTGYSTGPHLHFTVFKNSVPVDPLKYLH